MFKFIFDFRNNSFMRLWWGQLIAQFGERVNQMALIGLIAHRAPGSAMELAKILSFTIIPVFFVGPIAGTYVDRWDRRKTLFVIDFLRGLLVLTIPFFFFYRDSMVPIYIVVFLIFCFSRFHVPAKMSIIPDLVTKENLFMANSLMTTTGMIAFVLGCSLGGWLVDRFGAWYGFIINAAAFFVSGMFVFFIPHHIKFRRAEWLKAGREAIANIKQSVFSDMKEGVSYLINHREIRFIINVFFILLASAGAIYVVIIVFIQQSFQSITSDLGVLAVFLGIGLFIGAVFYGRWAKKVRWFNTIFACLLVGGFMVIAFALMVRLNPNLVSASVLALGLGLIVGPIFIAANTIVHFVVEERMRGKVFSALEIVIHFAFLTTLLLSSLLSEHFDRLWILIGVGCIFALVGAIGLIRYKDGRGLAVP